MTVKQEEKVLKCDKREVRSSRQVPHFFVSDYVLHVIPASCTGIELFSKLMSAICMRMPQMSTKSRLVYHALLFSYLPSNRLNALSLILYQELTNWLAIAKKINILFCRSGYYCMYYRRVCCYIPHVYTKYVQLSWLV